MMKLCKHNGLKLDIQAAVAAAEVGNLDVLKVVMDFVIKGYSTKDHIYNDFEVIFRAAIRCAHVTCLEYLFGFKKAVSGGMLDEAVSTGHLDCIKVLFKVSKSIFINNGYSICMETAAKGYLDCLKFLHSNGCKWDSSTCNAAASNGHLACLEYACNEGCPRDDNTCTAAARGGHIECLKFLKDKSCFWNEETCAAAASGGHIAVLKWLIDNGCPCDPVVSDAIDKVKPEHPAKKIKVEA
jgi:hypothetical protein